MNNLGKSLKEGTAGNLVFAPGTGNTVENSPAKTTAAPAQQDELPSSKAAEAQTPTRIKIPVVPMQEEKAKEEKPKEEKQQS